MTMPRKIIKSKRLTTKTRVTPVTQAVILAGGVGTRLEPFTKTLPKPLMPVGETPIIEILVRQLAAAGVSDIIVALGHGAKLIRLFLGDGSQFSTRVRYVEEKAPLGTVGPLRNIRGLQRNFFVLNGDILTNLNFVALARHHCLMEPSVTVATARRKETSDYGIMSIRNNEIVSYVEKPSRTLLVSAGVYVFSKKTLQHIRRVYFDFPELIHTLLAAGKPPVAYAIRGSWYDIGRPADWTAADRAFTANTSLFLPVTRRLSRSRTRS